MPIANSKNVYHPDILSLDEVIDGFKNGMLAVNKSNRGETIVLEVDNFDDERKIICSYSMINLIVRSLEKIKDGIATRDRLSD